MASGAWPTNESLLVMRTTACLLTRLKVRYSYSQPYLAHASRNALYSSSGHVGCMRYSSKMSTVPGPMRGARYSRISTVPWRLMVVRMGEQWVLGE